MANVPPRRGAQFELQNLSMSYGSLTVAEDVSLSFDAGAFVTFLGQSGSRKSTTTSMMIAGFTIPSSGDIRVNERSIIQDPVHKRNIGMVLKNYVRTEEMTGLISYVAPADNNPPA